MRYVALFFFIIVPTILISADAPDRPACTAKLDSVLGATYSASPMPYGQGWGGPVRYGTVPLTYSVEPGIDEYAVQRGLSGWERTQAIRMTRVPWGSLATVRVYQSHSHCPWTFKPGEYAHAFWPWHGSHAGQIHLNMTAIRSGAVQLDAAIAHEMGHVLGLNHEEIDSTALMYPVYRDCILPTLRDQSALSRLYSVRMFTLPPWGCR
jgi:hypothetical protein